MSQEVIIKVLNPKKEQRVNFSLVTHADLFTENGEFVEPNTLGLTGQQETWNQTRLLVTGEFGNRTYCVPGDSSQAQKHWRVGWGFSLAVEESLSAGNLQITRKEPKTDLLPIQIGSSYNFGFGPQKISEVISTSAKHIDIARKPDIPEVNNFFFQELENDLVTAGFGPSLFAITRQILASEIPAQFVY